VSLTRFRDKFYCQPCARDYKKSVRDSVLLTTTNNVDGFIVKRYIDIESVELVLGTGVFMEFAADAEDFFGLRSLGFEQKLQGGKNAAFDILRFRAYERGANAVIAIDVDYTEFSGNRIGLIVNGTAVEIAPEIAPESES
jgi:uncharacterized protein YbjQ (UPF0145 family)